MLSRGSRKRWFMNGDKIGGLQEWSGKSINIRREIKVKARKVGHRMNVGTSSRDYRRRLSIDSAARSVTARSIAMITSSSKLQLPLRIYLICAFVRANRITALNQYGMLRQYHRRAFVVDHSRRIPRYPLSFPRKLGNSFQLYKLSQA